MTFERSLTVIDVYLWVQTRGHARFKRSNLQHL